jgi:hypothetical protein
LLEGVGQSCASLLASAEVSLVKVGASMLELEDEAWLILGELQD